MSISIWDLIKYVFKWKWVIVAFTVLCVILASLYIDAKQTYSAKVIIQYDDACISNGKTLDGQEFDSNEIKAPQVILNVLKDLGYENRRVESIREKISIAPITPTTVDNLKAAKEKLGEEYQYFPKSFTVTYKGNSSQENTRNILSRVIVNYFKYYSENYLYLATLNEVDYDLNKKNFDYIEQIEQIQDNVKQTITSLTTYSKDSAGYRSPSTGLTFEDLLKEFERINEFSIPHVYTKIFEGQVTKNKWLLLNKYTERIESNTREMSNLNYKATLTKDRMDAYVEANKNVPNAYNEDGTKVEIIEDIEYDHSEDVEEETTYDSLIVNYANDSIAANSRRLDAEYCQTIIDKFTAVPETAVNYEECEAEVQKEIEDILTELTELYNKANSNIDDYNSYIPSKHIKKLSGVGCFENLYGSLYKVIALIGGLMLSTVAAIGYEIIKKYSKYSEKKEKEKKEEEAIGEAATE
ncbi:MAG: hypothetical protein J5590_06240 [Clostridia bacterium]|nr:hypothetical protein [Clostridia bacterium]